MPLSIFLPQKIMGIEMRRRILMMISILLCFSSAAVHAAQGNAVFYRPPYKPSACYQWRDNGVMITGVSDALWNNGKACGRRYKVRCIRGANEAPHPCKAGQSVVVTVVDYCRSPCDGILNLSQDAFARIADLDAGKVVVDYNPV